MEKIVTENLFLLEFLVDAVNLNRECECDAPPGETCVAFEFLDNAPLDVCEEDFQPKRKYGKETGIKSGKSCLFSLTPQQAEEAMEQFDITVTITKKTQKGWLPDKVDIGSSLISIVDLFRELISAVGSQSGDSPAAKTLKDSFNITNNTGQVIGKIGVYIRMSCFGKLIVTQFQMNLNDKSVLFKDKEGHSLYRYKKAGKSGSCPDTCKSSTMPMWERAGKGGSGGGGRGGGNSNPGCPNVPCQDLGGAGQGQPQMDVPCNECNASSPCAFPVGGDQDSPCPPEDPNACYQEIGAKMGGNALTIRVHKDGTKVEQVDPNQEVADNGGCSCGASTVGGGGGGGNRRPSCVADTQNYNMQPGVNTGGNTSPFAFKMGGCGAAATNNVTVVPPHSTSPDGMKYTELSDPDRDVFILRIGKKSEGADKKNNLELELCTPKGPDLKPLPQKETRDTQYDPKDAGQEEKKKGKGKEGGGKGKEGGGKGGKKGKK